MPPAQAPAPLQTATRSELIAKYAQLAESVHSINAAVTMQLTAGSAYSGVIEQYHQVNGFILAQKPSDIRVIGQAPVVSKNIFDMVSDGDTYHIFIPSKNQFLVGSAKQEKTSSKPIENLRPQHLTDAIFWRAIPDSEPILFEEAAQGTAHDYVLTVIHQAGKEWEIDRKIIFDRIDLSLSEIETYNSMGQVESEIHYSKWSSEGGPLYPRQISVNRPIEDYQFQIGVTRVTVNEAVEAGRFTLQQPEGSQLVRVGENSKEPAN